VHLRHGAFSLSATDLSSFLGCRHRTALDMTVALGKRKPVYQDDPLLDLLWQRGLEHERRFVDSLRPSSRSLVDLSDVRDDEDRVRRTHHVMREGADVIVQGGLRGGVWNGRPDVMRRVDRPSDLGAWSYEVYDTKLARETRAGAILQLCLYSELLGEAQGLRPERFHIVTPNPDDTIQTHRFDDYAAYFRFVQRWMTESIEVGDEALAAANYPEPVEQCDVCRWRANCASTRRADDHLSLVAGISAAQRRELEGQSVDTLTALAALPIPLTFRPRRASRDAYARARAQASLQLASRGQAVPAYEILSLLPGRGLGRLPEPSPGDLFLDLEGDLFARESGGGREYLFGLATAVGDYESRWAFTDAEERTAFEWAIDRITEAARAHPTMHVYHYAPYEPGAFTRLMGRHATREREFDAMLRAGRFVDLYGVVRQALRVGVESYSIKRLEPLYAFTRRIALEVANRNLRAMEVGLESGAPASVGEDVRVVVEGYNRDDCVSTLRLREWIERLRAERVAAGDDIPRPADPSAGAAPPAVDERATRVDEMRARLLDSVPEAPEDRNADQQARWLLAYCLDYHRREDRVRWSTHFRLCEAPEEDLYDKADAIAGLTVVERTEPVLNKRTRKPTGSVISRYRFPPQEMEIAMGATLWLHDKTKWGQLVAIDRAAGTIDVKKGSDKADIHPTAVCAYAHVPSDPIADALMRIGAGVAGGDHLYPAARALLRADPPRLVGEAFDASERPREYAQRIVTLLDRSVLAVQGPPGSGKTRLAAAMIRDLIKAKKRVGVTATGHKVIRHLLNAVVDAADKAGEAVAVVHKCDADDDAEPGRVRCVETNGEAIQSIASGEAHVVGGTPWLWSSTDAADSIDVLLVDEAGQMALANVVAVSQAAKSLVLLGDPQQLEQPRQGWHPDGVDVSGLEHLLAGHDTIPADRGVFLPTTWRLAPPLCRFTSEVFYEGRLAPGPRLDRQRVTGATDVPPSGLGLVTIAHDGNRNTSPEEVDAVENLVAQLTSGAEWMDVNGRVRRLMPADILVVSPYNAQVGRLEERLGADGPRVGTVDRFQGQEAPIVIYSMATSHPQDAPHGMEFLFSLNRLNVATSRALALAIVVASPRLFEAECSTPRQMQLANALCRFREMATPIVLR
jgi:predicted RecB family nuclease